MSLLEPETAAGVANLLDKDIVSTNPMFSYD